MLKSISHATFNVFRSGLSRAASQVRVWVPGCSTGEEVYSIIILLREHMDEVRKEFKIQVFGTDIDEDAISTARSGIYPGNIAIDVNPERLRKYFIREENAYRVRKDIREAAVFAVQNVIKDAPFTKLDILSCRNLLIYLDSDLQSRLMPLFHYSLKTGGLLFLGSSESIGSYMDLFRAFDKKWKFYRRTETPSANNVGAFAGFPWTLESGQREAVPEVRKLRAVSTSELARKVLIENFAPPSVLINSRGEILHVQGKTGKYLEPSPGQASLNIIDMAREGLQFELRSALRSVQQERMETVQRNIRVKTNGGSQVINLKIIPVPDSEQAQGLMLVSFEDVIPVKAKPAEKEKEGRADARAGRVHEIEKELKYTRENLQATIEELQASNEELKSANEEMQSTNEELQSTNEELETSKEEMQSVNEELATVNSELQVKIEQLSRAENDMRNLLDSTNIGIIFLDRDLRIKRFTQEATKLINLIHSDIGRPISHIVANLEYEGLDRDARQVLDALVPKEQEVRTRDGHNYLMRIMPYRTVENVIDGVTVTFTDIGRLKEKIGVSR
ncbi:MAG TPA: CheR family methyltransferase [Syntrophales bacterium]|nr:CheR family methyltransferase [Syntrophales bacterium]